MFGRTDSKTATVTTATVAPASSLRPEPVLVTSVPLDDNELHAYVRTAAAIGFAPAALLHARLLAFLAEREIGVFDYAAVTRYLNEHVDRTIGHAASWWWRPLRSVDVVTDWGWGTFEWQGNTRKVRDGYRAADWNCRAYHRAVPLRVLSRVEQLTAAFGDALKFFVTELGYFKTNGAQSRPDPFICVTALDVPRIVFDVWDEPGFSG